MMSLVDNLTRERRCTRPYPHATGTISWPCPHQLTIEDVLTGFQPFIAERLIAEAKDRIISAALRARARRPDSGRVHLTTDGRGSSGHSRCATNRVCGR